MGRIKVLIGHKNEVYCQGLGRLLADENDIEVIGTTTDGAQLIKIAEKLKPDVVIVDIIMSTLSGIEVAKQLKIKCPSTATLMLSDYQRGVNVIPSLRAGALGYLLESSPLSELVSAIHSTHVGEEVFAPKAAADILHHLAAMQNDGIFWSDQLHERELEILKLVAKGMPNSNIADQLGISHRTVSTHLGNIYKKLGVGSRTEATAYALKTRLVVFDDLS